MAPKFFASLVQVTHYQNVAEVKLSMLEDFCTNVLHTGVTVL